MATEKDPLAMSVLFPNAFVKAEDLGGEHKTVTIAGVVRESVAMAGGKKEACTVVSIARTPKKWIVNRTNGYGLALLLSPDLSHPSGRDWIGKRVILCSDLDQRQGEEMAAIRVAGSPDATPERSEAYARAWRGKRKGGELCRRLKRTLATMAVRGHAPPEEQIEPVVWDDGNANGAVPEPADEVFARVEEA